MRLALVAFAFAAILTASLSQAQIPMPSNPMPNLLPVLNGYNPVSIALENRGHENRGREPKGAADFADPSAPAQVADFDFRLDPARTRENLEAFIARTPDPQARADLRRMTAAQPDLIGDAARAIRPHGLDANNLADAYALWWINAWFVANQRDEGPDRATIAAVKRQARNALAGAPRLVGASDAELQRHAEAYLLQAILLGSAFDQWKGDPAMRERLAQASRQGAEANGLDLSRLTRTSEGFALREGAETTPRP